LKATLKDFFKSHYPERDNKTYLREAMEWLIKAQEANSDRGVSARYSLFSGWLGSYVETTGYIIPTFFNYYKLTGNKKYSRKALEMAEFILNKQLNSGAFPAGDRDKYPIVFNTGQVIFGLNRAFLETKDDKYRQAAIKASDWLIQVMDNDGCWRKYEIYDRIHTYTVRVAWSLLDVYDITGNEKYKDAAIRNITWTLTQQTDNGWFKNASFKAGKDPLLHTIAYTIRGLLECGIYLNSEEYINAAIKSADQILLKQKENGRLSGIFNNKWESRSYWSCLTGNAQMAVVWLKIYLIVKDFRYKRAAISSNNFLKRIQDLRSKNPGIRGGIKGSFPIYGGYCRYSLPNWATKFFADSLMLEDNPEIAGLLR
jgi:uncharacterized protein YyaL (SSP411 family)